MPSRKRGHSKIVVVGSGVAGLTAAASLARAGHTVTVYEQFSEIGGVTATLNRDGFSWDLGPTLLEGFAPDERGGRVLKDLGIADRIAFEEASRSYRFPDFELSRPTAYGGPHWRREYLKQLFPAERDGIDSYYRFYNRVMSYFALNLRAELARGPAKAATRLRLWMIRNRIKDRRNWSAQKLMAHFFVDSRLKAVFTSPLTDLTVRPSQFPALGIPILNAENSFDHRIPRRLSGIGRRPSYRFVLGGCSSLVNAIADCLRQHGGRIYTNATVQRILITGDRATGVQLAGGHQEPADIVIATGGARETFFELVGRAYLPADLAFQVDELRLMESVLMVHLGVDYDPTSYQPDALTHYYGTYDVEGSISACLSGDYHEGRNDFVIYIPTAHSPDLAPSGHHAITIYSVAPNELHTGTWQERRRELADKLVAQAEVVFPGLRSHIVTKVILTPEDFQSHTHQHHHALGGRAPVMGIDGPGYDTAIQGLWFIGSQSRSGGGVQNVMLGAHDASRMIQDRLKH